MLSCGEAEPPLAERWHTEPDSVAAEIAALPPVEQLAAVDAILLTDPQDAGQLCGALADGPARSRCRSVQRRPHLWRSSTSASPAISSPLADTLPSTGRCDEHATPTVCWSRHAIGRASAGDLDGAAGGCRAITSMQWQQECMFQAAEALLEARGADRYGDAVSLCALSGGFVTDCLEHSVATLAAKAPITPGGDWTPIIDAAEAITDRWQEAPQRGAAQRAALWALATALVYVEAPAVSGAPLTVLPEDAGPHVRAAMAWRLLALSPGGDLATLTASLQQAVATHQDTTPPTAPRRALVGLPDLWADAQPPAEAEVVTWMGLSQRVVSPDAEADAVIALLEAAARQPGRRPLLAAGRIHSDPLVAWSAQRLDGSP